MRRSLVTIFRMFVTYRPLFFFFWASVILAIPGLLIGLRSLYSFAKGDGAGHIQSLILAGLFVILATLAGMCGLIADLIATNRKLMERINQNIQVATLRRMAQQPDTAQHADNPVQTLSQK